MWSAKRSCGVGAARSGPWDSTRWTSAGPGSGGTGTGRPPFLDACQRRHGIEPAVDGVANGELLAFHRPQAPGEALADLEAVLVKDDLVPGGVPDAPGVRGRHLLRVRERLVGKEDRALRIAELVHRVG